jgi:hypothetical protein
MSLSENIHQAFMIGVDMNHIPKKIVLPCPQSKDNISQLEIMCEVVLFMMSLLS